MIVIPMKENSITAADRRGRIKAVATAAAGIKEEGINKDQQPVGLKTERA